MKFIVLSLLLTLTACAQLMNGQLQPVVVKDATKNIMFTTCGGAVEDWASCNRKALKACPSGYSTLKKVDDTTGINRELTFQCNQ